VAEKKVKYLNKGEYKRLSIAEEMVHGPKLLLMDEPTTGVSLYEASVLLLTFREMVNADRTVVASMYQPNAEAFRLFDSLLLISKGRVIYSGRISGATDFFVNSPYQYYFANYNNPAEFLADIAGGQISDCKVSKLLLDILMCGMFLVVVVTVYFWSFFMPN
jgi:ABC-type multidrug transport system ATPase subunit